MFLAVVGFPRPEFGFSGQIGIWEIMEKRVAQKKSKFHEKGDEYLINTTLNGDKFLLLLKDEVVPRIIEAVGGWAEKIIIQMDSAGGHGVVRNLGVLNDWGKSQIWKPHNWRSSSRRSWRNVPVEFVTQPTRSPDLNVLDLGAWNSLQVAVQDIKYEKVECPIPIHERLRVAVLSAWETWCCEAVVSKLFATLLEVNKKVVIHKGANNFDFHTKK